MAKTKSERAAEAAERLASVRAHLTGLTDPRMERTRKHELVDIIVLTLCAVTSAAEGWIAIEQYGLEHEPWLREFLDLPHGIPSHDTLGRVFSVLDPEALSVCLYGILEVLKPQGIDAAPSPQVVAIDGKTLRRSFDNAKGKRALHLLSAWATDSQTVLGQVAVDGKSNEITSIPTLLSKLELKGRTVTFDAMGCQKQVAHAVAERGADVVMTLKGNHSKLRTHVEQRFAFAQRMHFEATRTGEDFGHRSLTMTEKDHGRIETRHVDVLDASGTWFHEQHPGWDTIRSVTRVTSVTERGNERSEKTRFFLSSHNARDAALIASSIRAHWAIESGLHWTLDTAFREDDCRVRKDHAPENFATFRRLSLSLLKADSSAKVGIKNRRLKAAWNSDYLLNILGF